MGKQAGSVKGTALGIGCTVALVLGMLLFVYWVSHGDLVAIGVTVAVSVIGGVYTMTRPARATFPLAPADGQSRLEERTPPAGDPGLGPRPSSSVGPTAPASRSVSRLASLLSTQKGYKPVEPAGAGFGFIGRTRRWGQHAWIALLDADELDEAGIVRFAKRFDDLVWSDVSPLGGATYGILCFVFENSPSPEIVEHIRGLKRHPDRSSWMVYWTIDLATGSVIPHRRSPWGLYPGRVYLEKAIRS
jgi:hypothetical protein